MRAIYLLLGILLAACADREAELEERLHARRAALALSEEPLPLAEAMERIEARGLEGRLAIVGSRRLTDDEVFDAALRIESLLSRAVVQDRPAAFREMLAEARAQAAVFARAAARTRGAREEAGLLMKTCVDCHARFRKRR